MRPCARVIKMLSRAGDADRGYAAGPLLSRFRTTSSRFGGRIEFCDSLRSRRRSLLGRQPAKRVGFLAGFLHHRHASRCARSFGIIARSPTAASAPSCAPLPTLRDTSPEPAEHSLSTLLSADCRRASPLSHAWECQREGIDRTGRSQSRLRTRQFELERKSRICAGGRLWRDA